MSPALFLTVIHFYLYLYTCLRMPQSVFSNSQVFELGKQIKWKQNYWKILLQNYVLRLIATILSEKKTVWHNQWKGYLEYCTKIVWLICVPSLPPQWPEISSLSDWPLINDVLTTIIYRVIITSCPKSFVQNFYFK